MSLHFSAIQTPYPQTAPAQQAKSAYPVFGSATVDQADLSNNDAQSAKVDGEKKNCFQAIWDFLMSPFRAIEKAFNSLVNWIQESFQNAFEQSTLVDPKRHEEVKAALKEFNIRSFGDFLIQEREMPQDFIDEIAKEEQFRYLHEKHNVKEGETQHFFSLSDSEKEALKRLNIEPGDPMSQAAYIQARSPIIQTSRKYQLMRYFQLEVYPAYNKVAEKLNLDNYAKIGNLRKNLKVLQEAYGFMVIEPDQIADFLKTDSNE